MTDVFISCTGAASEALAATIAGDLEENGIRCWYTPRNIDLQPSEEAVAQCRVFIVLLTGAASRSQDVINAVKAASERAEAGENITILPFHAAEGQLDPELVRYVGRMHWIDGVTQSRADSIKQLLDTVKQLIPDRETAPVVWEKPKAVKQLKKSGLIRGAVAAAAVVLAAWAVFYSVFNVKEKLGTPQNIAPVQLPDGRMKWTENGDTYIGNMVNGKIEGYGTAIFSNGNTYEGGFVNGLCSGSGISILADGDMYEGEYANDAYNGRGTYTWSGGAVYVGEWKDDRRGGYGTMTFPDGDKYEGEWVNGEPNGLGTYTWKDGRNYVGEMKGWNSDGYGVFTYPGQYTYEGEWKDDDYNGYGKYVSTRYNYEYEGYWKDGEEDGEGKAVYSDGSVYEGGFAEGAKSGKGVLTRANGDVLDGEWKKGELDGHGSVVYSSGYKYEGEWKNGEEQGRGKAAYPNGDTYDGNFFKGTRAGEGVMTYANGNIYTGHWVNDERSGEGELYYAQTQYTYKGVWKDDAENGTFTVTGADGTVVEMEFKGGVIVTSP